MFSDLPLVVFSRGRNLRDQLLNSDLPPQAFLNNVYLRPYWMEITNVMAVLNAMALINVDPSNTPEIGKQIPIKCVITYSTKAVIYLITCPCGKNYVGKTKREVKVQISRASEQHQV